VKILAALKGIDHDLLASNESRDPEFDLGIIGHNEPAIGSGGNKTGA
jgi:hypothetical protein